MSKSQRKRNGKQQEVKYGVPSKVNSICKGREMKQHMTCLGTEKILDQWEQGGRQEEAWKRGSDHTGAHRSY